MFFHAFENDTGMKGGPFYGGKQFILGGMRQLATAALLSGRNVLVQTAGNCSPIGGQNLDFVQLQ